MKYIIVKGGKSAGKAETINEVCRRLHPEKICKVHYREDGRINLTQVATATDLQNGTYVVTVRKKHIMVVSGAPTRQRKTVTFMLESLQKLGIRPDFAIVAMSGLEKLKDFATSKELQEFGKCIYETKIWRIPSNKFTLTEEWNKRVSYLTAITLHNI